MFAVARLAGYAYLAFVSSRSAMKHVFKSAFEKGEFSSVPFQIRDIKGKDHRWEVCFNSPEMRWQAKEIMLIRYRGQTYLYFLIEDIQTQTEFYAGLEVGRHSILLRIFKKKGPKFQEIHIGEDATILLKYAFPEPLLFFALCEFLHSLFQNENFKAHLKRHLQQFEVHVSETIKMYTDQINSSFLFKMFLERFRLHLIPMGRYTYQKDHHPNLIDNFFLRDDTEELKQAKVIGMKYYQRNIEQFNDGLKISSFSSLSNRAKSKGKNLLLLHDLLVFVIKKEDDDEILYFATELFEDKYHHFISITLDYIEKQKDLQIKLTKSHSFKGDLRFSFLLDLISRMRRKYSFVEWNCQHYANFLWMLLASMSLEEQMKKTTLLDKIKIR